MQTVTSSSIQALRHSLLIALSLGAVLRVVGLTRQGFWTDELYVVWEARQPLDVLFNPQLHIQHPPGYRLALHAWMWLGGIGEWWVRLLPLLAGVALIVVAWALAKELWPSRVWAANGAALFVATSPFLVHYSQDATTYSWTALWVSLSVLLLVRAWRVDRVWPWIAWSASLAVSLYSHYFSLFPVAAEIVIMLTLGVVQATRRGVKEQVEGDKNSPLTSGNQAKRRLGHMGLAIVGAALLYAPWAWTLLASGGKALRTVFFPVSIDQQPVGWLPVLLAGYAHPIFWQTVGAWLAWGALLAGLIWAGRRLRHNKQTGSVPGVWLVLAWGVAANVGPYLILRVTTPADAITPVRFAALAAPALMLGLAALFGSLPRLARALFLGGWLALAGVQLYGAYTAPPKQDWRGIMAIVAREAQTDDAMLAFTAFHAGAAAAYYPIPMPVTGGWFVRDGEDPTGAAFWFPPEWRWRGFLDTDAYRSADLRGEIQKRIGGATRLWYLAGDGADGTYPPSPTAERTLSDLGWQSSQEWRASPLVLRLYVRR